MRRALPDDALNVSGPGPGAAPPPAVVGVTNGLTIPGSMRGRSGLLRFAALTAAEAQALPGFLDAFGDTILERPAILRVADSAAAFALIVMRPFGDKRGDSIGRYRLGRWPAERWMMASNYFNPDGFVEVFPRDANLPLSDHFRLGDFLTHDQPDVWPKYVIVEEKLIDKLELVLAELERRGVSGQAVVLSGFRAPYYNDFQIEEGAARASRHQYGDAADVLIDRDGDGRMDDLNRDRRVDLRDARLIGDAVAAVERRFPELAGGLGTYAAMGPRGPFAHVDVRGSSARWERAAPRASGATGKEARGRP
jgi:uncharacterized protein YcbK (DUF882 family)